MSADTTSKLDFILRLVDHVTAPAAKVSKQLMDVAEVGKTGFAQVGAGAAGMVGSVLALQESLAPAREQMMAVGEVRSLGVAEDALEALQRVTRLAVSIGTHAGTMTVADGAARFEADAFCYGPAARAEAARATFDPTYGRYTCGKLEILRLRETARARWGAGFSLARFHDALLGLGSPPLGLLPAALDRAGQLRG